METMLFVMLCGIWAFLLIVIGALRDIAKNTDRPPASTVVSFTKINVKPGDVVLFRLSGNLSQTEAQHVRDAMRAMLPEGVKFQLLQKDVDVTVLSSE
jgi:hypothetical protein